MKILIRSSENPSPTKPLAMAMGNFDGVHLGHQTILKNLLLEAKKRDWTPAVYTFDPHPAKILAPKTAPPLLQTQEQKMHLLGKAGIEIVVLEKFNVDFSKMSPEDFFVKILVQNLNVKALWVGYDFTFGFKRTGNIELLKKLCQKYQITLQVTEAQFSEETLISSTQIRHLVLQGKMDFVEQLLGRPFSLIGNVVQGYGYGGSKLGIHTANLAVENELLPKTGIYITGTRLLKKDRYWPSATSVGFNPTFPGKGFSIETHLIGFEGNLKGEKIEVEFWRWLRDEFIFPTPESLADQIQKDIVSAKQFHETLRSDR